MDERETTPRKRKLKFWQIGLVILGLLAIAFGVFRVAVRAKVQNRIAAIRAAGYPATCSELDAWYTIPAYADNAADYITGALTFLNIPQGEEAEGVPLFHSRTGLPARTQPLDEQIEKNMAQVVEKNRQALELLHAAVSIPECRYAVDLTLGNATVTSHLGPLRDAARLLMLEAVVAAARNDSASATQAVVSGYGLARSLKGEPLIISQLLASACSASSDKALEQVVNRIELSDAQLLRIEEAVLTSYEPNAIVRALAGERCFMLGSFRDPRNTGINGPAALLWHLCGAVGLLDLSLIQSLDYTSAYIEIVQSEPHRRQQAAELLESHRQSGSRLTSLLDGFTPALGRIVTLDLQHIAQLEATRTGIAVERYRLAKGALPETLADLTPAFLDSVPTDPFDGQPMRFHKLASGFLVYSVGPDGTDDEGQARQPRRSGQQESPYDLTFTIER